MHTNGFMYMSVAISFASERYTGNLYVGVTDSGRTSPKKWTGTA